MKILKGLILIFLLCNCKSEPDPPEPTRGKFYVENQSSSTLHIDALCNYPGGWACISDFKTTVIYPNSTEHIFNAFHPYGGEIRPSVFFEEFILFIRTEDGDSIIFEGPKDEAWQKRGDYGGVVFLYLVIEEFD